MWRKLTRRCNYLAVLFRRNYCCCKLICLTFPSSKSLCFSKCFVKLLGTCVLLPAIWQFRIVLSTLSPSMKKSYPVIMNEFGSECIQQSSSNITVALGHMINKPSCVAWRWLYQKVNLPSCLVWWPLCHKANQPSCQAWWPLCHKVNLLSCVARWHVAQCPLCHKVNVLSCVCEYCSILLWFVITTQRKWLGFHSKIL